MMRTNIEIDDELLAKAMAVSGTNTKRAAVEAALRLAIKLARQKQAIENLRGIGWEGDLDAMRQSWSS
jgi:Arc/MetJ family transcription regulator